MTHGVAGGIQAFQFHGCTDLDDVTGGKPPVDARNTVPGPGMGQQFRPRGGDHSPVAAGMIAVFVGVENLGDLPATVLGRA